MVPMSRPPDPKIEPMPMKSAARAVNSTTVLTLFLNISLTLGLGTPGLGTPLWNQICLRGSCEPAAGGIGH